jgi:hypothetical protein
MKDINAIAEKAADKLEEECSPGKMTQQEALEFLEVIIARLEGSADALREELGGE